MARNKYPEVTEQRILDAATKLFLEKGYDNTTIQDIVDELDGLTRGAVYHHFKSKADILDAVGTRMFNRDNPIEKVLSATLTGKEKMRRILLESLTQYQNKERTEISAMVIPYLTEPRFIAQSITDSLEVALAIEKIIEEGNQDGSLSVKNPKQAAEALLLLSNLWLLWDFAHTTPDDFIKKIQVLLQCTRGMGMELFTDEELAEHGKRLYYAFGGKLD